MQTSFAQDSTNPVSADPTVAFVPSGSALGHQRSIIPQSNLHSILANVAKKRIPSTGAAKPHRAGMFQMSAAEPRPGPAGMYDKAVALGAKKALLPVKKMLAMGVASGAHIALGAFLAVSVGGSCPGIKETDPGLQRALLGMFGLPMGLLMTVAAGGELVTGNFAVITAAWLEGKATLKKLCKNWITVIFANLLGSLLLAWFAFIANTGVGAGAVAIATAKCAAPFSAALVKGILCIGSFAWQCGWQHQRLISALRPWQFSSPSLASLPWASSTASRICSFFPLGCSRVPKSLLRTLLSRTSSQLR